MPYKRINIVVCLLLILIFYAPILNAQRISAGQKESREFGDLSITYTVSTEYAEVDVVFQLQNKIVGETILNWNNTSSDFDVSIDSASAKGSVSVHFSGSDQLSSLKAVVNITKNNKPSFNFKGEFATWQASDNLIYIEKNIYISPELRIVTSIAGEDFSKAYIHLYAINELLYSLTLMQSSPVAIISDKLIIGSTEISDGAKFTLTVPSPLQKGQVIMQCEFKSSNIPLTKFSSSIAAWEILSSQKITTPETEEKTIKK
jgi:hypothetical protein